MTEEFLQYVWKLKLFDFSMLVTQDGEEVRVIKTGEMNSHAGPDFFNARVQIGETLWAGNIEIHKKASDWYKHNHQADADYDNIILHVVEEADVIVERANGTPIPTVELHYDKILSGNYQRLIDSEQWIPCAQHIHLVDEMKLSFWLGKLAIERLSAKADYIDRAMQLNGNNWSETFYQLLARNFGFKTNAEPFELLAKSLPIAIPAKHKGNLFQIEALLFGQSGLLHRNLLGDDYFLQLRKEYEFFQSKYRLQPMAAYIWKFMRLRPNNFPTLRIAQFASLLNQSESLFSKIIECDQIENIAKLFKAGTSDYWNTHFDFNKPSVDQKKVIGSTAINLVLINTVIPFIFAYGAKRKNEQYKERAVQMLEDITAENNAIVNKWNELGIQTKSAFETQALIQLKSGYCDHKRCINCEIGNEIILSV